jgi:glycosyltransferase involved in cell wall biosynthesis
VERLNKIILISYYWPPSGGPGVQRWLSLAHQVSDLGMDLTVIIPENPFYPQIDEGLTNSISNKIKVVKVRSIEPLRWINRLSLGKSKNFSKGLISNEKSSRLKKLAFWFRANYFFPDARLFWSKTVIRYLKREIDGPVTLITTGPPHSAHLVGLRLKELFEEINWISDLRDPIADLGYLQLLPLTEKTKNKHQRLEKSIISQSDAIVTTSFSLAEHLSERYKEYDEKIQCITNGYDGNLIENNRSPEGFYLVHSGSLFAHRNSVNLWHTISERVNRSKDWRDHLKIFLVGEVSKEVKYTLISLGLEPYVAFLGYQTKEYCEQLERKAACLLLLESSVSGYNYAIPGKLFNYLKARRPILAIGPENWDVQKILDSQNVHRVTSDSKLAIESYLDLVFSRYLSNENMIVNNDISAFSRSFTAEQYVKLIKAL